MYYVYTLYSFRKKKLYYGYTRDLKRRLDQHQKNNRPYSFTRGGNVELIHYEAYKNEKDAREREKFFKTGWGRRYIRKILKNYLLSIK